jgi:hypothetical protein
MSFPPHDTSRLSSRTWCYILYVDPAGKLVVKIIRRGEQDGDR